MLHCLRSVTLLLSSFVGSKTEFSFMIGWIFDELFFFRMSFFVVLSYVCSYSYVCACVHMCVRVFVCVVCVSMDKRNHTSENTKSYLECRS